eukprot:9226112-Pyramimonas_sp.AAC.1
MTNQTQEAQVCSHGEPISLKRSLTRRRSPSSGYVLKADRSDAGSTGIFLRWTNQTQEAQVYSYGGPIRGRKHKYIPVSYTHLRAHETGAYL